MENKFCKAHLIATTTFALVLLLTLIPRIGFGDSADGEALFAAKCAKCHGGEGEGFMQLYPPLANSRYFREEISRLGCVIRFGLRGKIVVDGKEFNGIMPGDDRISDKELEKLVAYLASRWGDPDQEINLQQWMKNCSTKSRETN